MFAMFADLERVISLQRLDSAVDDAERRVAEEPERARTLDTQLETARQRVADAKAQLTKSQEVRRGLEKDLGMHQGRLSKFRDQLMAVKTNQEYQAMQKEIDFALTEVKGIEDKLLERMLEADELAATVKRAESDLAAEQREVDTGRKTLAAETAELKASLERLAKERIELTGAIDPVVLATFELVSKRRNRVAVAEARDGVCMICQMRLRPQVFNNIRRNDSIIQCDSCQRILYYIPRAPGPATAADSVSQSAQ
jgi:predicted  nucleic acid-binding Zn-ribbon protein